MLAAMIMQRPVGQGGLCEGRLRSLSDARSPSSGHINWLYDCGSNQKKALHREIAKTSGSIDILFISHVHSDHVSGIAHLLNVRSVRQIVLPYLEPVTCLMLMAQAAANGDLTDELRSFLEAPADWLRDRADGATITYVDGDDSPDTITPEPPPRPSSGEGRAAGRGELQAVWHPSAPARIDDGSQLAKPGSHIAVISAGGFKNWIFTPHVHKPSAVRRAKFMAELARLFLGKSEREIAETARTPAGLKDLRTCYNVLWKDHNLVSLSLYAGPFHDEPKLRGDIFSQDAFASERWPDARPFTPWAINNDWGWISTGDANLAGQRRRAAFCKTFTAYLPKVAVLLAPHHGSRHNWHDELLDAMPNVRVGVAPAGYNTYGHPHSAVKDSFGKHGVPFVQVGSDRRLCQVVILP